MNKEEIIELARKAGINYRELWDEFATGNGDGVEIEQMEDFAKLVAAQTLMKIDPSSFMSYQEGFEAGQLAERERIKKQNAPKIEKTNAYIKQLEQGDKNEI